MTATTTPAPREGSGKAAAPKATEGRPELPWGYGENRITAMVRDPDSAYLYWEITDAGIADARRRLGRGGARGWPNLRIYDTTGRSFDGTNANDCFDVGVDRADREYFLMIRRPGSTMHAEIGIMSHEGFFQAIARSGRADFPRGSPSGNTHLEWMTVTSGGSPPCVAPYQSRYAGTEPPLPGRGGAGYVDVWQAGDAPSTVQASQTPVEKPRGSARRPLGPRAEIEGVRRRDEWRAEWHGGTRFAPMQGLDPDRFAVELLGEAPARVPIEGGEMTVYGPWRILIRSQPGAAMKSRRIIASWSVRWVRAATPLIERWRRWLEGRGLEGGPRRGAGEGAFQHGSWLEGGAPEDRQAHGSEPVWLGASESTAGGASEALFLGGSRPGFLGASALRDAEDWQAAHPPAPHDASDKDRESDAGRTADHPTGERWGGRPERA